MNRREPGIIEFNPSSKFQEYEQVVVSGGFSRARVGDDTMQDIKRVILSGHAERIRGLNSFSQLIEYFGIHEVEFDNDWEGLDRSEHLVKRLAMAEALSSSLLVPNEMGLREKIRALLGDNDRLESIDEENYIKYINSRLKNPLFTAEELRTIVTKVSPYLFASFDNMAEESLLVLNALPNTVTRNSCAGHQKAVVHNIYFGDRNSSATAFISYKTTDPKIETALVDGFKSLQVDNGNVIVNFLGNGVYQLRYRVDATQSWRENSPDAVFAASEDATRMREDFFKKLNEILVNCLKVTRTSVI